MKPNMERRYTALYPALTLAEIKMEIALFEMTHIINGDFAEASANLHKYIRGWLARANYQKIKERQTKEPT